MDEDKVDAKNRILFITLTSKGLLVDMDSYKYKDVLNKFSQITEIPQN